MFAPPRLSADISHACHPLLNQNLLARHRIYIFYRLLTHLPQIMHGLRVSWSVSYIVSVIRCGSTAIDPLISAIVHRERLLISPNNTNKEDSSEKENVQWKID